MQIELNFTKKQLFLTLGTSLMAVVFFLGIQVVLYFNFQYEKSMIERNSLTDVLEMSQKNAFRDLDLSSRAYLVWDSRDQKIITSLNEELQRPLASLTKLMTVLVASNNANQNQVLTINNKNLKTEGENGLIFGEKWSLLNMIDFVLISSSNDGANALASILTSLNEDTDQNNQNSFVKKMNDTAKELGMIQSFFLNESGLDINKEISGAYGSVKDVTILMDYILKEKPTLLEASIQKESWIDSNLMTHQIKNTNIIVDKLPGVLASKTGYTDLAEGNLIMAFDIGIGHNIIISVMGSTKEARFEDMEKLFWASLQN